MGPGFISSARRRSAGGGGGIFAGARYWRLRFPDGSTSDTFVVLSELQLRSIVGGARQDMPGGGSASSEGLVASNAFDGNNSTDWSTFASAAINSWLANDLGSIKDVAEIFLHYGVSSPTTHAPTTIVVEYSADGAVWTQDTRWPALSALTWLPNQYMRVPRIDQVGARIRKGRAFGLDTDTNGWTGFTLRQPIPPSLAPVGGSTIKLGWRSGITEGMNFNKCYIGKKGAGTYDFASAPTQVTFGGSNSISVGTNIDIVSDEIAFPHLASDTLMVSWYCAGANDTLRRTTGAGGYKAGDSAATLSGAGSADFGVGMLSLVEVGGVAY